MSALDHTSTLHRPDAVTQAASLWLDRRTSGDMTPEQQADFAAWIAEPEHKQAYERLERTLQNVRGARDEIGVARLRAEARSRAKAARGNRWVAAIAACFALFFVGGVGSTLWFVGVGPQPERADTVAAISDPGLTAPRGTLIETAAGERLTITLDDGTEVTLNTRTQLEVRYSAGERVVALVEGQALFDVAHDASRPFIVDAGDQRVRALGTQFDVRRAEAGVEVTLLEGRVVVEELGLARSTAAEPEPVHVAELAPGEQFISATAELQAEIRDADIERVTSWRRGRMVFRDTSLAEAVAEANRYAVRQIVLADEEMAALRISGSFPTDQVDAFVEALTIYFPLEEIDARPAEDASVRRLEWRTD